MCIPRLLFIFISTLWSDGGSCYTQIYDTGVISPQKVNIYCNFPVCNLLHYFPVDPISNGRNQSKRVIKHLYLGPSLGIIGLHCSYEIWNIKYIFKSLKILPLLRTFHFFFVQRTKLINIMPCHCLKNIGLDSNNILFMNASLLLIILQALQVCFGYCLTPHAARVKKKQKT